MKKNSEKKPEIRVAETAGFCFGVDRAVNEVYRCLREHPFKKICTYGPIVHNESVVAELTGLGVEIINDRAELERILSLNKPDETVLIIRAHGISCKEKEYLESLKGLTVVDATCPYVSKIHETVRTAYGEGYRILVTGDPGHPEVKGIVGCVGGDATVISSPDDAEKFSCAPDTKLKLVSQTTFNLRKFEDIVEIFKIKLYDVSIVNTICNATQRRQAEAAELSRECDVMIVIGGKDSSNTAKLYEICRSECQATYYIQCLDDLSRVAIGSSVRCIGITAGASTPKTIIEEVLKYVRTEFWRYACRGAY